MVDCPIDSTEKEFLLLSKIPKRFMWTLQKIKIPMKDWEIKLEVLIYFVKSLSLINIRKSKTYIFHDGMLIPLGLCTNHLKLSQLLLMGFLQKMVKIIYKSWWWIIAFFTYLCEQSLHALKVFLFIQSICHIYHIYFRFGLERLSWW